MEVARQALLDRYPDQPLEPEAEQVPKFITNYVNSSAFAKREAARVIVVRAAKDAKLARKEQRGGAKPSQTKANGTERID